LKRQDEAFKGLSENTCVYIYAPELDPPAPLLLQKYVIHYLFFLMVLKFYKIGVQKYLKYYFVPVSVLQSVVLKYYFYS
jgi:hypothetical protein